MNERLIERIQLLVLTSAAVCFLLEGVFTLTQDTITVLLINMWFMYRHAGPELHRVVATLVCHAQFPVCNYKHFQQ